MVSGLIKQMRYKHHHKLDDAAKLTGVPRWTIHKLEHDQKIENREAVLRQIAVAYGEDPEKLFAADTPAGSFRARIAKLPLATRIGFAWSSFEHRATLALEFLVGGIRPAINPELIAQAAGVELQKFESYRQAGQWVGAGPTSNCLAKTLTYLGRVPDTWFHSGIFEGEPGIDGWSESLEWVIAVAKESEPAWTDVQRMTPIDLIRDLVEATQ